MPTTNKKLWTAYYLGGKVIMCEYLGVPWISAEIHNDKNLIIKSFQEEETAFTEDDVKELSTDFPVLIVPDKPDQMIYSDNPED
jgi:hypothetical protein